MSKLYDKIYFTWMNQNWLMEMIISHCMYNYWVRGKNDQIKNGSTAIKNTNYIIWTCAFWIFFSFEKNRILVFPIINIFK